MIAFLKPAYGRKYDTPLAALQDYYSGKFFIRCDSNWNDGPYCSKRDFDGSDALISVNCGNSSVVFSQYVEAVAAVAPANHCPSYTLQEGSGHD